MPLFSILRRVFSDTATVSHLYLAAYFHFHLVYFTFCCFKNFKTAFCVCRCVYSTKQMHELPFYFIVDILKGKINQFFPLFLNSPKRKKFFTIFSKYALDFKMRTFLLIPPYKA